MPTKTWSIKNELYLIVAMSLLLAMLVLLGNSGWKYYIQAILGLPFVLFFPGYSLTASVFPRRGDLSRSERLVLSCGLSLAVVPLVGLLLNYTPWGIRLLPLLFTLLALILVLCGIALCRRRQLPEAERYAPGVVLPVPAFKELPVLERILAAALALTIVLAAVGICYAVIVPKHGERYTEFYLLGPNDKADDYPTSLAAGKPGSLIVGVVNHEQEAATYTIQERMGGQPFRVIGPVVLSSGQKREIPAAITVGTPCQNLKVEFLLFRQGALMPDRTLDLWVDVHSAKVSAAQAPVHQV